MPSSMFFSNKNKEKYGQFFGGRMNKDTTHSAMFKCGGLRYTSTLSKFSWPLCWYSCNFRESEITVRPPELASWPPRVKKDEVLDILAVSECRIIPATCRSWSFFEPMLMIYLAQWDNLYHIEKSVKFENCSVGPLKLSHVHFYFNLLQGLSWLLKFSMG